MAEGVCSNYKTKCKGTLKCTCGTVGRLKIDPLPGRGSQFVTGYQCENCRKVTTLRVFGDGKIEGDGVKQKLKEIVPPSPPPIEQMRGILK